jgi:hypothetical protein
MPYALCPMPARAPHVTEKGYNYQKKELKEAAISAVNATSPFRNKSNSNRRRYNAKSNQ